MAAGIGAPHLVNMDDVALADLATAATCWWSPARSATAGRPTTAPEFWSRLDAPGCARADGVRFAVLGIGDRAYDDFCGHARSIDTRLAALGATRLLERVDCEAHDDEPMARWADRVAALLGVARCARTPPPSRSRSPAPIRSRAPLCRNIVLTAPSSPKEVRQFGFDISEYDVSYAAGDSLGVFPTNRPGHRRRVAGGHRYAR